MVEEKELPKVGEWWWYGFSGSRASMMTKCRVVAVREKEIGIVDKNGSSDCIPACWMLGPCEGDDIPKPVGKEQSTPWWRFW